MSIVREISPDDEFARSLASEISDFFLDFLVNIQDDLQQEVITSVPIASMVRAYSNISSDRALLIATYISVLGEGIEEATATITMPFDPYQYAELENPVFICDAEGRALIAESESATVEHFLSEQDAKERGYHLAHPEDEQKNTEGQIYYIPVPAYLKNRFDPQRDEACPITQKSYSEIVHPVRTPNGDYYEAWAIVKAVEENGRDPKTRAQLSVAQLKRVIPSRESQPAHLAVIDEASKRLFKEQEAIDKADETAEIESYSSPGPSSK